MGIRHLRDQVIRGFQSAAVAVVNRISADVRAPTFDVPMRYRNLIGTCSLGCAHERDSDRSADAKPRSKLRQSPRS
jgi:hypothetical protein